VPPSESFAAALPVPLTRRSAEFLRAGGCPRIGPVIPHGVDVSLYRPASAGERAKARERQGLAGKLVVGAVGAHSRRKRFDLILDALARLREEEPSAVLLAKTDRTLSLEGQDLELEARRRGLEGAVRLLLGELAPEAMVELYRVMDLYLNLSEWEGFCLPVVEAMACGVPVVCQPGQGPGEIVPYRELMVPGSRTEAHGPTALLRADPEAAAAVLREAARAPARLERLSLLGRQAAQESYGIDRVAGLWAGLLRETTERSPRALRRGTPPARPGSG
jgi:glycosyltransferase involved in cell wall biosynthesis